MGWCWLAHRDQCHHCLSTNQCSLLIVYETYSSWMCCILTHMHTQAVWRPNQDFVTQNITTRSMLMKNQFQDYVASNCFSVCEVHRVQPNSYHDLTCYTTHIHTCWQVWLLRGTEALDTHTHVRERSKQWSQNNRDNNSNNSPLTWWYLIKRGSLPYY